MKKIILFSITVLIILVNNSCGNNPTKPAAPKPKQLNISILLDLSDRITQPAAPSHIERDKEVIKTITEYFKKDMEKRTAWQAKGKIKVFFTPPPANAQINDIADSLKIDCSTLDNKGRKEVYDTLTGLFTEKLTQIYSLAMKQSTWPWPGSDIWRFFKDDVKDYCVERDTNYRNILIILTDGYIFHEDSKIQNGNRYTYLLTENIRPYRAPANWKQQIDGNNFGLITERNDLKDLEVLVLEISAGTIKKDEDILKYVIQKWLGEMKVPHSAIYSSDLPSNTKTRIENFLNEK